MTPSDKPQEDNDLDDFNEDFGDDFADETPEEFVDDGDEYADENWDDETDDVLAAPVEGAGAQKKKSGGVSNNMIIAGAFVVGLIVLGWQVVTKKPPQLEQFKSALGMTGATDGPVFGEKPADETGQATTDNQGFLNDQQAVPGFENKLPESPVTDSPPMPAPIASAEDTSMTPMPAPENAIVAEGEVDVTTQGDQNMVPRSPEDDIPDTAAMPDAPALKAEDILKQAIENRNRDTQAPTPETPSAAEMVAPAPVIAPEPVAPVVEPASAEPAPAPVAEVAALEEKNAQTAKQLEELTARLADMEQKLAEKDQKIESVTAEMKTLAEQAKAAEAAPAPSAPAQTADAAPKPAPVKKAAAPKKAKTAGGNWILRAAQPGRAWVSKQGEREMTALQVGDTLPGIGRITAISFTGGRWAVEGTQGNVRQ